MTKQESLVEMVDKIISVSGLPKQDQKIIDFVGTQAAKSRKALAQSLVLDDDSDNDYSSIKKERKPIEKLIEESPDRVVKMNSPEYCQLPVID